MRIGMHRAECFHGLTDEPIGELVPLARSWNHPPELNVSSGHMKGAGYNKFQRSYVLEGDHSGTPVEFQIEGSEEQPIVNPAFVLKGWGQKTVRLKINGVVTVEDKDFMSGYEKKLEGTDMVLWIKDHATKKKQYTIE